MNSSVRTIPINKPAPPSILKQIDDSFARIRDRAYELFSRRGYGDGAELDDWLTAERQLFTVPSAELNETANEYTMEMAAEGYKPDEIQVAVDADSVIVQGKMKRKTERKEDGVDYSEMASKELFRRIRLREPIDPDAVKASLDGAVLRLTMPKRSQLNA
jgi:HSP20 family protein